MSNAKSRIDIPLPSALPAVQPVRHGEDAFAMVNRHHEEVKALYRKALGQQEDRAIKR